MPGVDTHDRIIPGAWANFEADLAAHPPPYIVDVQLPGAVHYPVNDFPMLERLLADSYRPVAQSAEGTIYRAASLSGPAP